MVDWKKTTREIIMNYKYHFYCNSIGGKYRCSCGLSFKNKKNLLYHANNINNVVWIPDNKAVGKDEIKEILITTFEKYIVPDKEPKLMIESLGDLITLINHPISSYHFEILDRLGLLENYKGRLHGTPLDEVINKKVKPTLQEKSASLDKSVSSPKKHK